jgi:hypothetical protein
MSDLFMICSLDGSGTDIIHDVFTELDNAKNKLFEYSETKTYFDYHDYKIVIYKLDNELKKYILTNSSYTINDEGEFISINLCL